jgi:transcription-repair coupling factor (superfamily II helicase)
MAIPLFPKHLCVSTLPQISTGMGSVFSREILYRARCAQQEVFLFVFGSFASFEKFQQMDASRCILQDRASAMEWLLRPQVPAICHGDVLFIETSADHFSKKYTSTLSVGISLRFRDCLDALLEFGYIFEVGATSCASFCHEGDILHIRNRLGQKYTISWFGDEIEWIKDSEEVSYQNFYFCHKALSECATGEELLAFDTLKTPIYLFDSEFETRQQHFPQNLLHEFSFRNDQAPQEVPLQCESLDALKIIIESSAQSFVYSRRSHIGEVLKKHGIIPHHIQKTSISGESVYFPHDNSAIIADDLLSKLLLRPRTPVSHRENHTLLLTIHPHDYVVHQDHGIGQFLGITLKEIYGEKKEYFSIGFFA